MDKTWKLFESVAYEYVSHLYKNAIKSEHTVDSHDSGYDGIWIIVSDNKAIYKKIMMEAKYRESQSSLPLNDCAKAIIIAFNSSANKLYIATNIELAPQAQKQIKNFNKRTALAIVNIDNIKLKNYIHNNKAYLAKACKTKESILSDLESKIVSLPTKENNPINKSLTKDTCLLDVPRRELISNIVNDVCNSKKIIVSGAEGIGKSVLIDKICDELQKKKFDTQKIDLSMCTSSRILYLKVLEAVWGVSLDAILEDTDLITYIDKLIAIKGECIAPDISNAVKHIMTMNAYKYKGANDIYRYYLLKYLNDMLKDKSGLFHLAVIFENVDSLSIECVDFFLEIIEQMKNNGIRILLEIRKPFMLTDDIKRSNDYYKIIKKNALIYSVEPLSEELNYKLIRKHIKLDKDSCKQFSDMLEDNPLKIKNALEYMKRASLSVNVKKLNKMPYEEREIFWNNYGIDANREAVSLIMKYRTFSSISELLEMTLLLKGEIPYSLLCDYWGTQTDEIYEFAIDSRLFKLNDKILKCAHLRFLSAIKTTSQPLERMKSAQKLLPIIQGKKDANYPYIHLELLYILEQDIIIIGDYTMNVMLLYEDSQQYKKSIAVGEKYIERVNNKMILSTSEESMVVHVLLKMLHCVYELHADNEKEYEYFYQIAKESIILHVPDYTSCKEWYEYSLFTWHKKFIAGLFDDAYRISKELYDSLPKILCLFDLNDDIAGRIYSAHGLSLKMLEGGDAATNLFKEGIEKYPESYNAHAAYLSQEGNRLLKEKPLEAVKKYSELLDTVKGKAYPFLEIIHTRIDIAMSNFLAQEYDIAEIWAEQGLSIASTLGIHIQKGRALNILGCCKVANGEYIEGLNLLKESDFYLKLSGTAIYRWRVLLNQASVLLEIGDKKEAKALILQVVNILLSDFTKKIKSDNISVPYQSLLLILMYLHELEEDVEIILIKLECISIRDDFNRLCQIINWKTCFQNKVKYCNGIVLVTG